MEVDGAADVKNELPTPPASDVGSPTSFSHCGSDSEPDSPMVEEIKVRSSRLNCQNHKTARHQQSPSTLWSHCVTQSVSSTRQPNLGMSDRPAAGGSAGGMLDRSRMALCAFTFLFLSLNPLAALLCSSGSSSAGNPAATAPHHAGRTIQGLDITGRRTGIKRYKVLILF